MGADSSKVVHQVNTGITEKSICCLGWGVNFTLGRQNLSECQASSDQQSIDAILKRWPRADAHDGRADLPRDLTLIDIDASLPKLSILPSAAAG
jgi:anaphase-promoting complex subunit 4